VITGFKHKGLEKFFTKGIKSGIQAKHAERLRLILGRVNASTCPRDMNLTGLNLHELNGEGNLMRMHNPPHPGEILRKLCLEPLGLSVTEAAKALGISRKTLSSILNGHAGISPEMAVRLSIAFDTTAESWMNQQVQYDLWQAERGRDQLKVTRLTVAERINA
jgi:antitoxin HigA-1